MLGGDEVLRDLAAEQAHGHNFLGAIAGFHRGGGNFGSGRGGDNGRGRFRGLGSDGGGGRSRSFFGLGGGGGFAFLFTGGLVFRRSGRRSGCGRGGVGTGFDDGDDIIHFHAVAFGAEQLGEATGDGRGDFHGGLVGLEDEDVFILGNEVAFFFQPFGNFHFGDGFTDGGDFKFNASVAHIRTNFINVN